MKDDLFELYSRRVSPSDRTWLMHELPLNIEPHYRPDFLSVVGDIAGRSWARNRVVLAISPCLGRGGDAHAPLRGVPLR